MDQTPPPNKYEAIVKQVGDLPSLPEVVNKIIQEISLPETSAAVLANLISYDPGLTSKFIRIVNSAAYGFQRQISSVQHAIMILGFNTVRGVVLSASIFKMFENKRNLGLDPTQFWRHSIETGIGSRILAQKWKIKYAEDAFSAGMLHDIGKMMLAYHFTTDYNEVLAEARKRRLVFHGLPFLELEREMLDIDHADLGYQLAQRWKMPPTFAEVIRYHHAPHTSQDAPELVYVVALANAFSHIIDQNFGVFNIEYIPEDLLTYFQYDEDHPEAFEDLFKEVYAEMDTVTDLLISLRR